MVGRRGVGGRIQRIPGAGATVQKKTRGGNCAGAGRLGSGFRGGRQRAAGQFQFRSCRCGRRWRGKLKQGERRGGAPGHARSRSTSRRGQGRPGKGPEYYGGRERGRAKATGASAGSPLVRGDRRGRASGLVTFEDRDGYGTAGAEKGGRALGGHGAAVVEDFEGGHASAFSPFRKGKPLRTALPWGLAAAVGSPVMGWWTAPASRGESACQNAAPQAGMVAFTIPFVRTPQAYGRQRGGPQPERRADQRKCFLDYLPGYLGGTRRAQRGGPSAWRMWVRAVGGPFPGTGGSWPNPARNRGEGQGFPPDRGRRDSSPGLHGGGDPSAGPRRPPAGRHTRPGLTVFKLGKAGGRGKERTPIIFPTRACQLAGKGGGHKQEWALERNGIPGWCHRGGEPGGQGGWSEVDRRPRVGPRGREKAGVGSAGGRGLGYCWGLEPAGGRRGAWDRGNRSKVSPRSGYPGDR